MNRINKLSIYLSNTQVFNAIDTDGVQNAYSGSAVPENEAMIIPELAGIFVLLGEKANIVTRFLKFGTFKRVEINFQLSPSNRILVEANKLSNILTIGGPAYNNATKYFQFETTTGDTELVGKTKLYFWGDCIKNRRDKINAFLVKASLDYDYGILEKIEDGGRTVIVAAGFHVNGTRGSVKYLLDNWRKLQDSNFVLVIKFPHPSKDLEGYKKPLEIKRVT
ncbi:MAG: hypothetical protein UT43_C0002G0019 [Parcubacteria group bacterium GW2011_GWC1_39_29]|nr:MAG: hypothetical protein UT43_C0002G0019 [Parcubacteria group bacterium GW2011_GWC1_39_29]